MLQLGISTVASLTCNQVQSLYQDSNCCDDEKSPIRPECANNEMERKCLSLSDLLRTPYGNIDRTEIIDMSQGQPYCRIQGRIGGPFAPFSVGIPLNLSNYENRLCARTGKGYDIEDGQIDSEDENTMRRYKCMMSFVSTRGDASDVIANMNPRFMNTDGGHYIAPQHDVPKFTARVGHVTVAWKRILNEIATHMYGEKPKYAYIYGCSGRGAGCVNTVAMDGGEWNGARCEDFFTQEVVTIPMMWRAYSALKFEKTLDVGVVDRLTFLRKRFCDAFDGVQDDLATWDCPFHPKYYSCASVNDAQVTNNGTGSLPGFAGQSSRNHLRFVISQSSKFCQESSRKIQQTHSICTLSRDDVQMC